MDSSQKQAAREFALYWKDKGYEKGQSQQFWMSLLTNVFGVSNVERFIVFEEQVKLDHTSFIDGWIPQTKVLIEQKGVDKDLRKPIKQSDGSFLNPFQQAKRYAAELPYSQRPRWIVTCNFAEFLVYDMEQPNSESESILLKNFEKEYYRLSFLSDLGNAHLKREMEVSVQAGNIVGLLYDRILEQYKDPTSEHSLKSLNMLCVRLVFCLFAEDAGIFGHKSMFHDYLSHIDASDLRTALIELFKVLDTKVADRDPYMKESLAAFPYVNGGLFADESIEIPLFTPEIKDILLRRASDDFDWSEISPTIFGAVFESTLNPVTRRSGGMHYTSIENIHKVIDPLFLDRLKDEIDVIKQVKEGKVRTQKIDGFRVKLSSLKFLDPACGSGNFLTETYISLRRLENEAIQMKFGGQSAWDSGDLIKVSIGQFYGIEVNDFAVTVAKTALWIAESQMMAETEQIIKRSIDFLPLKSYANIVEGNALRLDWGYIGNVPSEVQKIIAKRTNLYQISSGQPVAAHEPEVHYNEIDLYTENLVFGVKVEEKATEKVTYDYIMGNPPFVGARLMSSEQKDDLLEVFGRDCKNLGNLDYVGGWYKKAAELLLETNAHAALVSTNSVTQGEQPAILWKPLMQKGIIINFAYRTFRWDSESTSKAHVHCVIVGFSANKTQTRHIFPSEGSSVVAKNINAYLVDAPDVFVESRTAPLCDVPAIGIGNKPIDGGNYLFTKEEMEAFISKEPQSQQYFHRWIGADEFINHYYRYCLWLGDCTPGEIRRMPLCLKRVQAVRDFRLASRSGGTRKLADRPTRFHVENMPKDSYLLIPRVSSERRRYIPIGYIDADIFLVILFIFLLTQRYTILVC